MIVKNVRAIKIWNSRREETISVTVETKDGKFEASAPGGKSRGKYEANPFSVKGIQFSIEFVNVLGRKLSMENFVFNTFSDLEKFEELIQKFDKTPNFEMVGANAVYAFEAALLKALAASYQMPLWKFLNENPKSLPLPLGNCIGGGKHVSQDRKTDFQEFLILPKTKHFFDAYFMNLQAYKEAKRLLFEKDSSWEGTLTDESAMASTLDNESVLGLLLNVREEIKKKFKAELCLGLDVAASSFWNGVNYPYKNMLQKDRQQKERMPKEQQIKYISKLIEQYNLSYVEDPLEEDDFDGFALLLRTISKKNPKCLIVGDDLICTQYDRLRKAIQKNSINGVIIKPNQNGSILRTKAVVDLAKEYNITPIISHRSGETTDNTIAHLAVGWQIPIIKTGILGKERFAKLNELLRIERSLGIGKQ